MSHPGPSPASLLDLARRGVPLDEQCEALMAFLAARGVSESSMMTVLRHTVDGIVCSAADRPCTTRIGGQPVLPAGLEWPCGAAGKPMRFVALFDFAELPRLEPLPADGVLAIYWDFDWHDAPRDQPGLFDMLRATRTFYLAPGSAPSYPDPPAESHPIHEAPLHGHLAPIPGEASTVADELRGASDRQAVFDAMNELAGEKYFGAHQLLGATQDIQWSPLAAFPTSLRGTAFSPESRERFSEAELDDQNWTLLGEIRSGHEISIADGGSIYLVMLNADLRRQRFDRVVGWMDSH